MADGALLLDADVHEAAPGGELVVDGERLAPRERAGDEGDAYLVGGGVVGARPHSGGSRIFSLGMPQKKCWPLR